MSSGYSVRVQLAFDLIDYVDFHQSDVDGPGYTVGKFQARSDPGNGRMLPGQLALWQVGKVVCVYSGLRLVASAARPVGTVAGGQSCRPPVPVTDQLKVYHIGQICT